MPAVQTSYPERMAPGYPGLVANMETANSISRIVEDAAGIGFGIAVFQGVADLGITATPSALFKGVTIADKTLVVPVTGGTVDVYPHRSEAGVHTFGAPIWIIASVAVAPGQPAYVTASGAWTNVAAGNTAIRGAIFDSTAVAGGLAKLRLGGAA